MQKTQSPSRVASNFMRTYGRTRLIELIEMFRSGTAGPKIAHVFSVSRQRVHQWKSQLGSEKTSFIVDPEVEKLIIARRTNTRTSV